MNDNRLNEVFLEEFRELAGHLETDILKLEDGFEKELVNDIFRYVHTIKGSSGIMGYTELSEFAHQLENLLDMVRAGELKPDQEMIDLLLESLDWMKIAVYGCENIDEANRLRESLFERIGKYQGVNQGEDNASEQEQSDALNDYRTYCIKIDFSESIFTSGIDPLRIMADLLSKGEAERLRVNRERLPAFEKLDPEKCYIGWEVILKTLPLREGRQRN